MVIRIFTLIGLLSLLSVSRAEEFTPNCLKKNATKVSTKDIVCLQKDFVKRSQENGCQYTTAYKEFKYRTVKGKYKKYCDPKREIGAFVVGDGTKNVHLCNENLTSTIFDVILVNSKVENKSYLTEMFLLQNVVIHEGYHLVSSLTHSSKFHSDVRALFQCAYKMEAPVDFSCLPGATCINGNCSYRCDPTSYAQWFIDLASPEQ